MDVKYKLLNVLGITAAWRWLNRNKISIAMLHGVGESKCTDCWTPSRPQLPPEQLDRFMGVLSRHYEFISLNEAAEMIAGEIPIRPNCMAFSIDDGYKNAIESAWPVFQKYNVIPTVYFVTDMIGTKSFFWHDRLDCALQRASTVAKRIEFLGTSYDLSKKSQKELGAIGKQMIREGRKQFEVEGDRLKAFEKLVSDLDKEIPLSDAARSDQEVRIGLANTDEICKYIDSGGDIGSHSVSHRRFGALTEAEQWQELTRSKENLERRFGNEIRSFCYPEGSYSDASAQLAVKAGYRFALTTDAGLNAVSDDLMKLKRFQLPYQPSADRLLVDACDLGSAVYSLKRKPSRLVRRK